MKAVCKEDEMLQTDCGRLLWSVPIVALLVAVAVLWMVRSTTPSLKQLYAAAVADAVVAEAQEIEPLVELTSSDSLTTWDEQGRVLLLSWHCHPQQYPAGQEAVLSKGAVLAFTDKEIAKWYVENKQGIWAWELRLKQLLGLPPDANYTHFSGFWVSPNDVIRPAYITDCTAQMQLALSADPDPAVRKWFEESSLFSEEDSAYPWTRLGYTYDWANNGVEYGLTEFLIEENASVEIAFTKTTKEFIAWLEQQ